MCDIVQLIRSMPYDERPSGAHCSFIPGDDMGIKIYYEERVAERAYSDQFKVAEAGLAPPVGDWFGKVVDESCRHHKNGECFAFETGVAVTAWDEAKKIAGLEYHDCFSEDECLIICEELDCLKMQNDYFGFLDRLRGLGINVNDDHAQNWGFFGDQIVWIDFGVFGLR